MFSQTFYFAWIDMETVSQNLSIDCFYQPTSWHEKNYRMTVRKFSNGSVEVMTKAVRPMSEMLRADARRSAPPPRPNDLTSDQYRRIDAEIEAYRRARELRREAEFTSVGEEERFRIEAGRREEYKQRNIRRAKQQVRWLVKQLGADHMVTLTYRENMECLDRLLRDWKEFVRLVRKVKPDWRYVACRERQDRGAYHLHIAVKGRQDISLLRRCWYQAIGGDSKASGDDTPGQVDVRGPSKRWGAKTLEWKCSKISGYMTKYLHKAFDELDGASTKRYWSSRKIDRPEVIKVWLASSDFVEAIKDTHRIFRTLAPRTISLWASEGYECIWVSG